MAVLKKKLLLVRSRVAPDEILQERSGQHSSLANEVNVGSLGGGGGGEGGA